MLARWRRWAVRRWRRARSVPPVRKRICSHGSRASDRLPTSGAHASSRTSRTRRFEQMVRRTKAHAQRSLQSQGVWQRSALSAGGTRQVLSHGNADRGRRSGWPASGIALGIQHKCQRFRPELGREAPVRAASVLDRRGRRLADEGCASVHAKWVEGRAARGGEERGDRAVVRGVGAEAIPTSLGRERDRLACASSAGQGLRPNCWRRRLSATTIGGDSFEP